MAPGFGRADLQSGGLRGGEVYGFVEQGFGALGYELEGLGGGIEGRGERAEGRRRAWRSDVVGGHGVVFWVE